MVEPRDLPVAYQFCPICGTPRRSYAPPRPFRCHVCGFTSFFGPVAAVGGIICNEQNQVLLIERARDPGAGKLGMPGGFVDPNETAEESLEREVLEEVGLKIRDIRFLLTYPNQYSYQGVVSPVLDLFFVANVENPSLIRPQAEEVASWMWTDLNPLLLERMAFPSNRAALEFFLAQLGNARK